MRNALPHQEGYRWWTMNGVRPVKSRNAANAAFGGLLPTAMGSNPQGLTPSNPQGLTPRYATLSTSLPRLPPV
jgi:hypothetical protein